MRKKYMMPPIILIAEDDAAQGALIQTALERRGYHADLVTNGLEAVRRLRSQHYDLALLDYQMPDVDGLAAARLLHDLMPQSRPRLIAVTAAAAGLNDRGQAGGDTPFDAIVCKSVGLPALLCVIDANLADAAGLDGATDAQQQQSMRLVDVAPRRRWLAPMAALPALAIACSFVVAFGLAVSSLRQLDRTSVAAERARGLSTDAADLVGAVQNAEMSERSYLATGLPAQKDQFGADAQRVDQLLVAANPLRTEGLVGSEGSTGPQSMIELRMQTLAGEAKNWRVAAVPTEAAEVSAKAGRDTGERLRDWAANAVFAAQQAVLAGLESIRYNIDLVLVALGLGVCYGLWNAVAAVRRQLERGKPVLTRLAKPAQGGWPLPPMATPLLLLGDD